MNQAIAHLDAAALIAEHNAPISEQAGDLEQAGLQREVAADCRQTIEQLQNLEQELQQCPSN